MDAKLLLAKSITLLYRESQLSDKTDSSSELIRTVLEDVQVSDFSIGLNSDREIIAALKTTILEMCSSPQDHVYDKVDLLQRLRLNCGNDEKLYDAIKQGIEDEMTEPGLKRSIVNMRKSITNHFREQQIGDILNKSSHSFKFKREGIKDINEFVAGIVAQLDALHINGSGKDPAVIGDIDLGNEESLKEVFHEIQGLNSGNRIYRTGWQWLNRMTQNGIRPGECVVVGALQHKYKTGFTLSVFSQIALFNKPHTQDPNKKPLLLRISFEDELVNNLQFVYQYLKYNETKQYVDIKNVSVDEMSSYVKTRLQVNGFHIKMLRVDPNQWTYKNICNKVIELESQGYSVEGLMVDYLSQINKTGCVNSGPVGSEVGDLLSRMRNFCSAKGIWFVTPHQLSTEAKALLRTSISEDQFVKEVAEKGYWENNKGLDRIFDLGLIIHLFKHNKETYFAVARDKHRIPTIVDDEHKFAMMKFPKLMPIPHDIEGEDISFRRLKDAASNTDDELFSLG